MSDGDPNCPICHGKGLEYSPVADKEAERAFGIPLKPGSTYAVSVCKCRRDDE